MKILFLSADLSGGAGIACQRQAEALRQLGHEVDILTLSNATKYGILRGLAFRLTAKLNRKFEYEIIYRSGFSTEQYKSVGWLPFNPLRFMDFSKYDFLHLHWVNRGILGLNHLKSTSRKIKIVWTLHSCWPFSNPHHHPREQLGQIRFEKFWNSQKSLIENATKLVSYWITPSTYMKEQNQLSENVKTINNCLPSRIAPALSGISSGDYAFVCNGDVFDPRKGLQELLESWNEIWNKEENRKLHVIGPLFEHSAHVGMHKLSTTRNVYFHGNMPENFITSFLRYMSATIIPSYEETFGQVILESLSVGCPVIVNRNIKSLSEFAIASESIRPISFNAQELELALIWASSNGQDRIVVADQVKRHFEGSSIAGQLQDIYFSLMD